MFGNSPPEKCLPRANRLGVAERDSGASPPDAGGIQPCLLMRRKTKPLAVEILGRSEQP